VKWCKAMGVPIQGMEQEVYPAIFKCLNELMEKSSKCVDSKEVVTPVPASLEGYEPNFDEMTDNELREWLIKQGKKPHHMAKRPKLLEMVKDI